MKPPLITNPKALAKSHCCNFKNGGCTEQPCEVLQGRKCFWFTKYVLPREDYKFAKDLDLPALHFAYNKYKPMGKVREYIVEGEDGWDEGEKTDNKYVRFVMVDLQE